MSKVFFIADTHFGHRNICKYRSQFSSPQEHDELLISNWNKVVIKKKYQVWVLGDMCICNDKYNFDDLIKGLNGTIRIITGNHCYLPAYKNLRIETGLVKKYGFWLSHCPIHPQELRGHKNIHGHIHDKTIDDDRYICVCPEHIDYKPIELEEIRLTQPTNIQLINSKVEGKG